MTKKELKELIKEVIAETIDEAGGYEDGIKDAKDRMKYVALRKMEKDHLAKSKITKDIKKQHHLDMADKYLQQALDIAKKHNKEAISESMSSEQLKNLGFIKTNDDEDYTIFKKDDSVITFNKQTGKYTLEDVSDRNIRTYVRNGTIKDVLEYL